MTVKYSEAIYVRVEPSLKAALDTLLVASSRDEYPTMGDLLRDILSTGVKARLKGYTKAKEKTTIETCACVECHTCGKENQ